MQYALDRGSSGTAGGADSAMPEGGKGVSCTNTPASPRSSPATLSLCCVSSFPGPFFSLGLITMVLKTSPGPSMAGVSMVMMYWGASTAGSGFRKLRLLLPLRGGGWTTFSSSMDGGKPSFSGEGGPSLSPSMSGGGGGGGVACFRSIVGGEMIDPCHPTRRREEVDSQLPDLLEVQLASSRSCSVLSRGWSVPPCESDDTDQRSSSSPPPSLLVLPFSPSTSCVSHSAGQSFPSSGGLLLLCWVSPSFPCRLSLFPTIPCTVATKASRDGRRRRARDFCTAWWTLDLDTKEAADAAETLRDSPTLPRRSHRETVSVHDSSNGSATDTI
eukprot:Sspe_Gene.24939::Locus_9953_Transcript_1_1_Confidence_1.000_Length_2166::g.24939::m.24939